MVLTEEDEECIIALCILLIYFTFEYAQKPKIARSCWTRSWISRRQEYGAHHALLEELRNDDPRGLRNFLRMDLASFAELLQLVSPLIKRRDTLMRKSISPAERLSLTLRFLATGETYQSLEYLFRVPKTTLSDIIPETCDAIYRVLKDGHLKVPSSIQEWEKISQEFGERWNFSNCIGAIDGKHITIKHPFGSGSKYYNYKGQYSVVLMAVVDSDYKFIVVDVGCNGRVSDGGIFANSTLYRNLENSSLSIPPPRPLSRGMDDMPYVIVGDEAFPLKSYLLKPYPSRNLTMCKRIFNYRLSRARRIVENAFGILASRFAVFQKPIALDVEKVEKIVLCACVLHNYLRSKSESRAIYTPSGSLDQECEQNHTVVEGDWRPKDHINTCISYKCLLIIYLDL